MITWARVYMVVIRVLAIILLACGVAWAAPSITDATGTFTSGQTITITGSDFGSKATAAPVVWDTIEDGTADTTATTGTWSSVYTEAGWGSIVASTTQKHAGTYSARGDPTDGYARFMKTLGEQAGGTRLYGYMWRMRTEALAGTIVNQKLWRLYPDSNKPNTVISTSTNNGVVVCEDCGGTGFTIRPYLLEDVWQLEEVEFQLSSAIDQADGVVNYYIDGVQRVNYTSLMSRCTGGDLPITQFVFDNQGGLTGYIYMDDLYLDTTWARVVLGDQPTLAASTHREIQPATSWTEGTPDTIEITFNPGSFSSGTAYLFVVDSDGTASAGKEITVGSGSSPSTPTITGVMTGSIR